jgi:murein endopeptidase
VIRHFRKHDDHMHVRFTCHASDPECKTYRPLLARMAAR